MQEEKAKYFKILMFRLFSFVKMERISEGSDL